MTYTIPDAPDAYIRGLLMLHQIRIPGEPPQEYIPDPHGAVAIKVDQAAYDAAPDEWKDELDRCDTGWLDDGANDEMYILAPGHQKLPMCECCEDEF